MRTTSLFGILACAIAFSACSKSSNTPPPNPPENVNHLVTQLLITGTDTSRWDYQYDGSGKMTGATYKVNNVLSSKYDVSYQVDVITIITRSSLNQPVYTDIDTTRLFINNGQAVKSITSHFFEYSSPPSPGYRYYNSDTTNYLYDADGLLTKCTNGNYDSTWQGGTSPSSDAISMNGVSNYTNATKNVTSWTWVNNITDVAHNSSGTSVSYRTQTFTNTYGYAQSFLNKSDFSNEAVMTQIGGFGFRPWTKNYQYLPSTITRSAVAKDQAGNVISSSSHDYNWQYTANADGLLSTRFDPTAPGTKFVYVYEK
jgi:hypothetical protein